MPKVLFLAAFFSLAACNAAAPVAEISVEDGWARATAPGQPSAAAYLTIVNSGDGDVRMTAVSSDIGEATLHRTVIENGMARMRSNNDGLAIPAGSTVLLQPQGDHVMLMGLGEPLEAGHSITLTLSFEGLDPVDAQIAIVEPGSR